jgi:hypothetical protein
MNPAHPHRSESLEAGESILAARARSQRTLTDILQILGYPEDWAAPLESQLYRRGRVWRQFDG